MKAGILVINFGEPENPTPEEVIPFLEKIFALNMSLEGTMSAEQQRARVHQLATNRAAGLIEEYKVIGGSPLHAQAHWQAKEMEKELRARGFDATAYIGMQFTEPGVEHAVAQAHADGVDLVVGLPVYPLCGPSTTVAALQQMRRAIDALDWKPQIAEISGWHTHSAYVEIRADAIRRVLMESGADLNDPRTRLVFSAHGTPLKYLREGSRYERYVKDICHSVARALYVTEYAIGYQNHSNRPLEWTQPDIGSVIETIEADTVIVDACSFMHEQSETLAELDHELREDAEARGLKFYRVPIPHDDARFVTLLADLVEPFLTQHVEAAGFRPCSCRPGAFCLNQIGARIGG
jgi:ferrochelatase